VSTFDTLPSRPASTARRPAPFPTVEPALPSGQGWSGGQLVVYVCWDRCEAEEMLSVVFIWLAERTETYVSLLFVDIFCVCMICRER